VIPDSIGVEDSCFNSFFLVQINSIRFTISALCHGLYEGGLLVVWKFQNNIFKDIQNSFQWAIGTDLKPTQYISTSTVARVAQSAYHPHYFEWL